MSKGLPQVPPWLAQVFSENGHADPRVAQELAQEAYEEARTVWARQEGRRIEREHRLASEVADLGTTTTAAHQLTNRPERLPHTVESLHATGDSTMLVAQNKVGKTTLALNLVKSLVDGEPFLGEFDTEFSDGRIMYLNYELSDTRFLEWLWRLGLDNPGRLVPVHLRGKLFPLDHPAVHDRLTEEMRRHEVAFLIIDPFQRAFSGESESNNTEVGRFLGRVDELKEQAGVPDLVLVDHAGHSENAKDRARAASVKGGWPDSTWALTKAGSGGKTDPRFFTVRGRGDVEVTNRRLSFDEDTQRLTLEEQAGAATPPPLSLADHGLLAVIRSDGARGVAAVRKFFRDLEGSKHPKALRAAEEFGYVRRRKDGAAHTFEVLDAGWERHGELQEMGL